MDQGNMVGFVGWMSRRRNPTFVHHRRLRRYFLVCDAAHRGGTNVGLRFAYPTYKTDVPPHHLNRSEPWAFTTERILLS
jgi:hypothetical protein